MKLLIVSPTPTHPPTAGNRARIFSLAKNLGSLGHDVHFAWVTMEHGDADAMKAHFKERLEILPYSRPPILDSKIDRFRRRLLRGIGNERSYIWRLDDWYDESASEEIRALHARHNFDAVLVEYVFLSRVLDALPDSVLKIIDTHDRFSNRHAQYLRAGKRPEWFSTTEADEKLGLRRADVVLAIQEEEAQFFSKMLCGKTEVVTVGHLLDLSCQVSVGSAPRAVFVGSSNSINADAANYFIRSVLPLVRSVRPDFQLILAGGVGAQVSDAIGVQKLGHVASIQDAYAKGSLAINPVRMGTGLNIKTMECLAFGVPLVSTATGSRGLDALQGRAFVRVPDDDAGAMAAAVIALLNNPNDAQALGRAARQAAELWNTEQLRNLQGIFSSADHRRQVMQANCCASGVG